jgi:hypothetical protein
MPRYFIILDSMILIIFGEDVPWLRRLGAGLSPRRPDFAHWSVHVGFVVDKVALGQVTLRGLLFSLSISFHHGPPYPYTT